MDRKNKTITRIAGVPISVVARFVVLSILAMGCLSFWNARDSFAQTDYCGDVNGDQKISPVDALIVLQSAVGVPVQLSCPPAGSAVAGEPAVAVEPGSCGDVNGDGNTSTVDALMILNYSVGVPIEFHCASSPTARNLLRYLNGLICQGADFTSNLEVKPSGAKWKSVSGVESEYKPWNEPTIGDTFHVTLGKCGEITLTGTINLPENLMVRMRLRLGGLFNDRPEIVFEDEGPIGMLHTERLGDDRDPLAVLRGSPVAGITARAGSD